MAEFSQFDAFLNILLVVIAITLITRRLRFPYTIGLILAGLFAATYPRIPLPDLSPQVFVSILLPPILFEAALKLDVEGLTREVDVVFSYSILGTLLMLAAVSFFAFYALDFAPIEALLLGIIVSPTDPIAVLSAFKERRVNSEFKLIVEGEALFNDGVAVVAYSLALTLLANGSITGFEFGSIALISIVGGVAFGIAGGYLVHFLIERTDDKFVELLLCFFLSFGIYRLADEFGASGVIATIVAGLIINYRINKYGGLIDSTYEDYVVFWDFIGFVASSIAFIFIGLNLLPELLASHMLPITALTLFILAARYLKVHGLAALMGRLSEKAIPWDWRMGLWWTGLRGAVSVVLALSISGLGLLHGEEIKALTFGIVLATNVIWGLTIPYAMKRYHLTVDEP
ncbi:MAG: sodium:proton antiporter [Candidatus Bathyarchaeia archaeon]